MWMVRKVLQNQCCYIDWQSFFFFLFGYLNLATSTLGGSFRWHEKVSRWLWFRKSEEGTLRFQTFYLEPLLSIVRQYWATSEIALDFFFLLLLGTRCRKRDIFFCIALVCFIGAQRKKALKHIWARKLNNENFLLWSVVTWCRWVCKGEIIFIVTQPDACNDEFWKKLEQLAFLFRNSLE